MDRKKLINKIADIIDEHYYDEGVYVDIEIEDIKRVYKLITGKEYEPIKYDRDNLAGLLRLCGTLSK